MVGFLQFSLRSVLCVGFSALLSSPLVMAQDVSKVNGGTSSVSYDHNAKTVTFSIGADYYNSLYAQEIYQALDVRPSDPVGGLGDVLTYAKTAGITCYKETDQEMVSRHYCRLVAKLALDYRSLPIVNFGQNIPLWRALKNIAQSGKYEAFKAVSGGGYEFEGGGGSFRIFCNMDANCRLMADNIQWAHLGNNFFVRILDNWSYFILYWTGDEAREIMDQWDVPSEVRSDDFVRNVRKKIFGNFHPTESRFLEGTALGCFANSYVGRDTEVECDLLITIPKPVTMERIKSISLSQGETQAIRKAIHRSQFPYILNGGAVQLYCPREENQVCRVRLP